jgi:hypothetical protein
MYTHPSSSNSCNRPEMMQEVKSQRLLHRPSHVAALFCRNFNERQHSLAAARCATTPNRIHQLRRHWASTTPATSLRACLGSLTHHLRHRTTTSLLQRPLLPRWMVHRIIDLPTCSPNVSPALPAWRPLISCAMPRRSPTRVTDTHVMDRCFSFPPTVRHSPAFYTAV